jgi:predicted RNase H-like HicB family nuclease
MSTKPATPAEAEELAKKAVGEYLTACRMASADPAAIGNYLMKLASVTGCLMANAEGADTAFDRLLGTAQFVLKTMPKKPATLHPVQ